MGLFLKGLRKSAVDRNGGMRRLPGSVTAVETGGQRTERCRTSPDHATGDRRRNEDADKRNAIRPASRTEAPDVAERGGFAIIAIQRALG